MLAQSAADYQQGEDEEEVDDLEGHDGLVMLKVLLQQRIKLIDGLMGHPTATSVQRFKSVPHGQETWFRIWASTTYHGIPHPKLSTRSLCAHYWRVLAGANGPDQASHRFRTLPCF